MGRLAGAPPCRRAGVSSIEARTNSGLFLDCTDLESYRSTDAARSWPPTTEERHVTPPDAKKARSRVARSDPARVHAGLALGESPRVLSARKAARGNPRRPSSFRRRGPALEALAPPSGGSDRLGTDRPRPRGVRNSRAIDRSDRRLKRDSHLNHTRFSPTWTPRSERRRIRTRPGRPNGKGTGRADRNRNPRRVRDDLLAVRAAWAMSRGTLRALLLTRLRCDSRRATTFETPGAGRSGGVQRQGEKGWQPEGREK